MNLRKLLTELAITEPLVEADKHVELVITVGITTIRHRLCRVDIAPEGRVVLIGESDRTTGPESLSGQ